MRGQGGDVCPCFQVTTDILYTMEFSPAKTSLDIRIVSWCCVVLFVFVWIILSKEVSTQWVGYGFLVFFIVVILVTYTFVPTKYILEGKTLSVVTRAKTFVYHDITKIEPAEKGVLSWIRLFGIWGLFCVVGIFWSRKLGRYRAYLTNTNYKNIAVITLKSGKKVVVSPENISEFL